jgi:hypothetical protein
VDNAGHCRRHEPWESQQPVDKVEDSTQKEIVVVGFAVLQLVTLVIDKVPGDAVVQEDQEEGQEGWSGCEKHYPSFAAKVRHVDKPSASSEWFGLVGTVIRKVGGATCVATLKGRLKLVWDIQCFGLNVVEDQSLEQTKDENSNGNCKVVDRSAGTGVAKESRVLESPEEEDEPRRSQTEQEAQKARAIEIVVDVVLVLLVRWVVWIQEMKETNITVG